MRIIFSKDRPAQLDLLLRSLERYAPAEETWALWYGSTFEFKCGYDALFPISGLRVTSGAPRHFDSALRTCLGRDGTVTFFCDDDVVFRAVPDDPREYLAMNENILAFSWRLAIPGWWTWNWADLPRTGHGYPGSIDGHTFRTSDVQEMIAGQVIENPTMLETVLALGCEKLADRRPLMAAWPEQVLVGVPVNRVSETSGCPNGERFPQPVEELNRRFLAGERIALDRLDFSGVDGCHHEIQYEWE